MLEISPELKKLQEEIARLKKELEDKNWADKKINEGIKNLYKELERKGEELKNLDALKTDFVSTVSHELRTPLSLMKESIALVLDEVPGKINKKQRELLELGADNIDRLTRVINSLLDISKIEAGKVELNRAFVDLAVIVSNMCARWKAEFKKKKQVFGFSVPEAPANIYVDPDKIIQVLHNLISNAVKFTPEKGTIRVALKEKDAEVDVVISDTGIGISGEDLPKVFGKFQQFKRVYGAGEKGTGLGLSICKEIVQMHGGSIKVESELHKGSRFTVTLPKKDVEVAIEERVDGAIDTALEKRAHLSLLLIYLPTLDEVRKKLGYGGCHYLMKHIEGSITDSLRSLEDIVMTGRNEVIIILPSAGEKDIAAIKNRIEKGIAARLSEREETWVKRLKVSFGYVIYPGPAESGREMLKQARAVARI